MQMSWRQGILVDFSKAHFSSISNQSVSSTYNATIYVHESFLAILGAKIQTIIATSNKIFFFCFWSNFFHFIYFSDFVYFVHYFFTLFNIFWFVQCFFTLFNIFLLCSFFKIFSTLSRTIYWNFQFCFRQNSIYFVCRYVFSFFSFMTQVLQLLTLTIVRKCSLQSTIVHTFFTTRLMNHSKEGFWKVSQISRKIIMRNANAKLMWI